MSGDNWSPDARKWGYYAEDDEDEHFVARPKTPSSVQDEAAPPDRKPEERAQAAPPLAGPAAVQAAQQMAGGLAAQSGSHPGISWAVGVLEESGRAIFYATSNEGAGYLPPGLRWDPRLRHVFGPSVPRTELPVWLGLANPARAVLDHYLFLRSARPGLRLAGVVSTQPPGDAVAAALRALGGACQPPDAEHASPRPDAAGRLAAVSDGSFDALISGIPVRQLWTAGLDLAADAARRCRYHVLEPQLAGVLDGLGMGKAHPAHAEHVWHGLWRLTAQAQACRVPDTRLGPVDPGSAGPTFAQAVELGAGFGYIQPFFAARTTAILYALLCCRLQDEPLGEEQLAEAVYEHICVAEDTAPARAILARHSAVVGDDDL